MRTIEIARKMAELGQQRDACAAYTLAAQRGIEDPAAKLEAAAYILQMGGNYKISYTCFLELYRQGCFQNEILPLLTAAFYEPNVKTLQSRYERNCKLLKKYPYLFRKDFLPFEELPIRFYPYDEHDGYVPFYVEDARFGEFINFKKPVVSRNFFRSLEDPILAGDVFSQYELEYLNDNVRRSEDVGRENHIYLHYSDWGVFCSYLQCLNLRQLLDKKKIVFLMEHEMEQYPIDFKTRFGIDYSQYPVKPIGIRDITRLIWHTQLSSHNGGDFFNEIFDMHPNLIAEPSRMMSKIEQAVAKIRQKLDASKNSADAVRRFPTWDAQLITELYLLKNRTDKDILVGMYLTETRRQEAKHTPWVDVRSRIAPAIFFQPHFPSVIYNMHVDQKNQTTLYSKQYDVIRNSPIFQEFKYIKTFTPMRRMTTSYGGAIKFAYNWYHKKEGFIGDVISDRILNRSFMIDPQDRLFMDSVLVRFEDGKLNPKATFTALAAFLDLPYTESLTYCSEYGKYNPAVEGKDTGFDTAPVYRTYDDFTNDSERYFIEYFLRDAYENYGYDFHYYDGAVVDQKRVEELIGGFTKLDYFISYMRKRNTKLDEELTPDEQEAALERAVLTAVAKAKARQTKSAVLLMRGLHFVSKDGQPLRMMPMLQLDPSLLEQPLYR